MRPGPTPAWLLFLSYAGATLAAPRWPASRARAQHALTSAPAQAAVSRLDSEKAIDDSSALGFDALPIFGTFGIDLAVTINTSAIHGPLASHQVGDGDGDDSVSDGGGIIGFVARLAAYGPNPVLGRQADEGPRWITVALPPGETDTLDHGCKGDYSGIQPDPAANGHVWRLAFRGECSFVEKTRLAQKAGFAGLMVADNANGPFEGLVTMYASGDTSDVTIPSMFITLADYGTLRRAERLGHDGPAAPHPPPGVARYIVVGLGYDDDVAAWPLRDTVVFIIFSPLSTLSCVYLVLYLQRRRMRKRELASPETMQRLRVRIHEENKPPGPEREADAGPSTASPDTDSASEDAEARGPVATAPIDCVICLEEFAPGDRVVVLPCHHEYHEACVTPWLTTRRKVCPICKRDISLDARDGDAGESTIGLTEDTPLLNSAAASNTPGSGGQSEDEARGA